MKDIVRLELNQNWERLSSIHRKVLGIWYTNGFVEALFYLGSYFNHSCYPNVCFTYNDAIQKETFHTLRDIKQGEELTISYIPIAKLDLTRRQFQLKEWGFDCQCISCDQTTLTRREREKIHAQIFKLTKQFRELSSSKLQEDWIVAVKVAEKCSDLLISLDLHGLQLSEW
jgi:hypothetical protein